MRLVEARAALRAVVRAPLVPALVVALAATGLGFVLALLSLIDALYLRPLPFPQGERIVAIYEVHPERGRMAVVPANLLEWSRSVTAFTAVSGSQWIEPSIGGEGNPERVTGARVLPGFFDVWGLAPLLGRSPVAADFGSAAPTAIVSERIWRLRLHADPGAIGSSLRIDGVPHTVIGVMPEAASSVGRVEVWIPWDLTPQERTERRYHMVGAIGRLRGDRSAGAATAELEAAYARIASQHAEARDWRAVARPLRDDLLDVPAAAIALMSAVVFLTFVVACLNVGALLSAWWSGRAQELLTRIALGATRARLVRQLMAEGAWLAAGGTAGALLVAQATLGLFASLAAPTLGAYDFAPRLDARVAGAAAVALAAFVLATAFWPAFSLVNAASRVVADTRTTARSESRVSMAIQVAIALVVAATAGALVDNVRALTRTARADPRQHQAIEIVLPETRYRDEPSHRQFFTRLLSAIRARPEVAGAGASSYVPPTQAPGNMRFGIEGRPEPSDARSASPAAVDPEAFALLGAGLVRGRLFDDGDGSGSPDVAIVSAALARRYWNDGDPLGQRLEVVGLDRPVTIVGVVSDVRQPIAEDPRAEIVLYLPFAQVPWPFMTVVVEPARSAAEAVAAVSDEVRRLDDAVAPGVARGLEDVQTEWLRSPRLHAAAVTLFGLATLLLTLAGIHARVACRVARGRREWAVRQALGATPSRLVRGLLSDLALVSGAGVVAGLVMLPLASSLLASMVYGARLLDWPRALGLALLLSAAAIAAGAWPSRRAARTELAQALRQD